jgi:hypothetical protein
MLYVLETVLHPEDSALKLVCESDGFEHSGGRRTYRIKLWLLGVAGQVTGLQRSALRSSPRHLSHLVGWVLEEGAAIFYSVL